MTPSITQPITYRQGDQHHQGDANTALALARGFLYGLTEKLSSFA
jgi:hypothetical protein